MDFVIPHGRWWAEQLGCGRVVSGGRGKKKTWIFAGVWHSDFQERGPGESIEFLAKRRRRAWAADLYDEERQADRLEAEFEDQEG